MKLILTFLFLFFSNYINKSIEPIVIYGEKVYFSKNVDGELSYDLSKVYPDINVIFVLPIKIEVPKDTVYIKPGFKKY